MNDITITVSGIVGSDVRFSPGDRGARANFRLASTSRYFDRVNDKWTDGPTTWLDVVCWRRLAEHVYDSVSKGDPVIVVGRMRVRTWENENGKGQSTEISATSVGHDLTWGVATYSRRRSDAAPEERSEANEPGLNAPPADVGQAEHQVA